MKRDDGWATWWMILAMVLLAVIIVLTCLMPPVFRMSWGTFWQAAAAMATAGAAGVALWLGWREGEWRRSAEAGERQNALLYAVSKQALFDEIALTVRELRDDLRRAERQVLYAADFRSRVAHCSARSRQFECDRLVKVDVGAALQLAEVPYRLHTLSARIGSSNTPLSTASIKSAESHLTEIEQRLRLANDRLFAGSRPETLLTELDHSEIQ